jgi:tRNA (guanine-N7-)-methyltransferase
MPRSIKYEIPGTDWRRGLMDLATEGVHALFAPQFTAPDRVVVEVGFGRGEFMLDMAAKNPEVAFIAVEVSFKRVLKMARKVARARLGNVRLIEARGEVLIKSCLEPGSIDEFWVNFSDPWPKATHARRRLIQPETVAEMARALKPGGEVHVATDDIPYAEQIQQVLEGETRLENVHSPLPYASEVPGRTATSYELDWRAQGRRIHFFDYRCRS